jgi:hypothetical protein
MLVIPVVIIIDRGPAIGRDQDTGALVLVDGVADQIQCLVEGAR